MKSNEMTIDSSCYEAIIEASTSGIIVLNAEGFVVVFNKAAKKISHKEGQEVVGKHFGEVNPNIWPEFEEILKTGIPQIGKRVKVRDLTLFVSRTPVIVQNKIIGVVSIFQDITELQLQLETSERLAKEYYLKLEEISMQQVNLNGIVAVSKQMKDVVELALRVAPTHIPVLLQGETGVGKEVIAKLIHEKSDRSIGAFIKINCGAIPETLLESELFGYVKGAFTGASQSGKRGLFELAEKGTIFFDEIETLSLNLQSKLLSVLQDFEVMRIGDIKPKKIDARLIVASNCDLNEMTKSKSFREDLFFRLNVVPISIPPLRERKEDILFLVNHFLQKYNLKYEKRKYLSIPVIDVLTAYEWRGNVRELSNAIERLVVMTMNDEILLDDLPSDLRSYKWIKGNHFDSSHVYPFKEIVWKFESHLIQEAISKYGNARKASKILKVHPSTITRKIKKYLLNNAK